MYALKLAQMIKTFLSMIVFHDELELGDYSDGGRMNHHHHYYYRSKSR